MLLHFILFLAIPYNITANTSIKYNNLEIKDSSIYLPQPQQKIRNLSINQEEIRIRDREEVSPTNNKKRIFVIKVIAPDAQTTPSTSTIYNKLFSAKEYSVASQLSACSYSKFQIEPLVKNDMSIENGIDTISINVNVNGTDHNTIRDEVLSKVLETYGSIIIGIDFLMLCLPPGTTIPNENDGTWYSYSILNNYLSVFNNEACADVSLVIREMIHNLGYGYTDYNDKSCYMSNAYTYPPIFKNGPRQCLNSVKSWHLGWYSTGHNTISTNDIGDDATFDLIGIANYNNLKQNQYTIIMIDTSTQENYWILFNRKETINSQVLDYSDLVLVTKCDKNDKSADSVFVAALDSGDNFTLVENGVEIIIFVENVHIGPCSDGCSYARIHIGKSMDVSLSSQQPTPAINDNNTQKLTPGMVNYRTLFVILVKAPDSQLTIPPSKIYEKIYSPTEFSAASQYNSCSYSKLQLVPLHNKITSTDISIENGMGEVSITTNVVNRDNDLIREEVLNEVFGKYGSNFIQELQIDHLLLCLPPGTFIKYQPDWRGYGLVSHYLSVYNDVACTYVSVLMHEIGHNLGLGHSDVDYEDRSCIMGYSYPSDDGPKLCFNGVKSWTLGWYATGHLSIDLVAIEQDDYYFVDLIGVSNYNTIQTNQQHVIVQMNTNTTINYWIAFNRKVGMNDNVEQGGDLVLVTSRISNDTSADSTLVAELDTHGIYHLPKNVTDDVLVKVVDINFGVEPVYARIFVGREVHSRQSMNSSTSSQPISNNLVTNVPSFTNMPSDKITSLETGNASTYHPTSQLTKNLPTYKPSTMISPTTATNQSDAPTIQDTLYSIPLQNKTTSNITDRTKPTSHTPSMLPYELIHTSSPSMQKQMVTTEPSFIPTISTTTAEPSLKTQDREEERKRMKDVASDGMEWPLASQSSSSSHSKLNNRLVFCFGILQSLMILL